MNTATSAEKPNRLTLHIMISMVAGILCGFVIRALPLSANVIEILVEDILKTGGDIFISILKMLVVPVVFVSLVYGSSSLDIKKLGRVGGKTMVLYLITTAVAIALAIFFATLFSIGKGGEVIRPAEFVATQAPSLKTIFLNLFPANPFRALVEGEMLQIIIFSILFGVAISSSGAAGQRINVIFKDMNDIVILFVTQMLKISPYGIFCLMAVLFSKIGFDLILQLLGYFSVVLFVLFFHAAVTYSLLLRGLGKLNPWTFFKKFRVAMLFAFSTSSSNASIPVVLESVENRLGVKNSIASFVIPLGATVNMDGTAIMQGVATVFIANIYHVPIGLSGYLLVILMATLASIGTAGIPSVGLITLAMVLKQVNVPVEGIALIIGVDRLLDMTRTVVNVTGDAVVACVVAKNEKSLDLGVYNSKSEVL